MVGATNPIGLKAHPAFLGPCQPALLVHHIIPRLIHFTAWYFFAHAQDLNMKSKLIGRSIIKQFDISIPAYQVTRIEPHGSGLFRVMGRKLPDLGDVTYITVTTHPDKMPTGFKLLSYDNLNECITQAKSLLEISARKLLAGYTEELERDERIESAAVGLEITGRRYRVTEIISA